MDINNLIETLEKATENALMEEEEKDAIIEIIQRYRNTERHTENLRQSHYWIARLNVDLMDALKESIAKETIREIIENRYPDEAVQKLIEMTEEE